MTTALPVNPTDSSAPPPSSAPTSISPSPSPIPPKDVAREIQQEAQSLQSEDESIIMKAAASLVMLATLPEAEAHLRPCVPRLISFLHGGYSIHVQRNACAALTAIMNASPILYHAVAEASGLMKGILGCLQENVEDFGLRINALATLGVLSQQGRGVALVKEAGVEKILLSLFAQTLDAKVEEELVDTFCALAAHEQMRPTLLQKGVVSKLASRLGSDSPEICVRVLLALGMLCGSSMEGCCELAGADGAVKALVKLMMSNDHDIRSISRDLFAALTSNQETRHVVEQMMRNI